METVLVRKGFNCSSIHGDKSQDMRTRALEEFRSGKVGKYTPGVEVFCVRKGNTHLV